MTEPRVRDLFAIPESVGKETFVLKLAEGVTRAEETARSYVVTPTIVTAIDDALRLVKTCLEDGRSRATYVHGSFGSGKSHYMAILSLLLEGNEAAWRIPELHPLRDKHASWLGKRLLQLRFHMVGEDSLEGAIFRTYVRWVRENHPSAPVPALFADQDLFADAARLLDHIGDEAFFSPMNPEADEAWGEMSHESAWSRARFDEAARSADPKLRGELFDALVRTHFAAFARQSNRFVGLDEGLAILAGHAKSLGYDAVILFLDELVLWLASGASNAQWMHTEVQKAAKLVEAQDMARPIPIVGYIARQRDLAEMVGDEYAGAENKRLRDSLNWFKERFGKIELGDQNLPAIVEKRVLQPKDDTAKKKLDEAFAKLQREARASWSTLQAGEDGASFRKLYPFSPALIETLVALSNSLQRNRTALKLLTEILVDHIGDLKVGDVVPVGDLWDLVAGGDDSTDGVMRERFETAKQLYRHQLLPLIHESNGTGTPEKCQRLRPDHRVSLGCSGCPQTVCRNDNRVVKTMLLAALLPEVAPLRELTVSRLVQLNHGTIRAPIPGTEASLAAQRLRNWASRAGEIQVGNQADPTVAITIGLVNLKSILDQARGADNQGARQQIVKSVLFDALELDRTEAWGVDHKIPNWRGSVRTGHVRFGNVRRLGAEALRCPDDHDWRLVIDYPFDEPAYGPNDDLEVVDKVREEGNGTWTLVWLPSFFSEATNTLVGEIAILDHVLASKESIRSYTQHLRVEDQLRAETALRSLRDQKRMRLEGAIAQAYGLARESEHDIDPTRSLAVHLHVLKPGVKLTASIGGPLSVAMKDYVPRLLEVRYPRHPDFPRKPTRQVSERVIELFGKIIDADDKRLEAERDDLDKLRATLVPLGLVRVTESAAHLIDDRFLEIERKRQQKSIEHPSAGEVREWFDENGLMGLQWEAADLVVRCYTRWSARTLTRGGRPFDAPFNGEIPSDVVLEKPVLPLQTEWTKALDLAGHAFGITLVGKALHADNLKRFEADLAAKVKSIAPDAAKLPIVLAARLGELGLPDDADRLRTAKSADALCAALQGKSGVDMVRALASFTPETSATALGRSLGSAKANVAVLEQRLVFGTFQQLRGLAQRPDVRALLAEVGKTLRVDELHEALASRLRDLAETAQSLLTPPPPIITPPKLGGVPLPIQVSAGKVVAPEAIEPRLVAAESTKERFREAVADAVRRAEVALADVPADAVVEITIRIRKATP